MLKRVFNSIRSKLIVSSTVVVIMLVVLIELIVYSVATQLQVEDAQQLNRQLVASMGKSFDDMDHSFRSGINFITINSEFQAQLQEIPRDADHLGALNVLLKKHLSDRALLLDEVDAVYLFDKEQSLRVFWNKKNWQYPSHVLFPSMEQSWFSPIGRVRGRMLGEHLVYTRQINDMRNLNPIGFVLTVYDRRELEDRVHTISPDAVRQLIVLDQQGNVVTHNCESQAQLEIILWEMQKNPIGEEEAPRPIQGMGRVLLAQYKSAHTGWQVVSLVPLNHVLRAADMTLKLVLGLGALFITIGIVVQALVSSRIVKPLQEIVKTMRQVDEGDYSRRLTIRGEDELSALGASINQMLDTTDNLINQNLRDEIMYRDAQIAALQAQINPHMLYNTLEGINWLAEFGDKDKIRTVTIAFSHLMKALASGPKMVALEEELSYTNDFLCIYQTMLCDKMVYSIDTGDVPMDFTIPRLTIQPLVENAVVHGIKQSVHGGHIHVNLSQARDGLLISISDDGAGMSRQMEQQINRYARGECGKEESILFGMGMRNVIDRIHLLYPGGNTVFTVSSSQWGTTVDIVLPIWEQEGER